VGCDSAPGAAEKLVFLARAIDANVQYPGKLYTQECFLNLFGSIGHIILVLSC
jgi:hypothetical protein